MSAHTTKAPRGAGCVARAGVLTESLPSGYIIGTLPSQFVQMRVRPSRWLPALEIIWGALVMCMAAAPNVQTIYGIRFVIGICEASAYPGMMTLLGNWYTPQELGKRSIIFQQSSAVAQMFSGWVSLLFSFFFVFSLVFFLAFSTPFPSVSSVYMEQSLTMSTCV